MEATTESPSADYLSSVHTVELDRDDHREKRSLRFYHPDGSRPLRPTDRDDLGDDTEYQQIPRDELLRRDADPQKVFVTNVEPGAPIPAEPGEKAVFERKESGRARYLGTLEELNGRRLDE